MVMTRTVCAGCGSDRLTPVLDLGTSPLADEFPTTPNAAMDRYPLVLLHCPDCTLVQLAEVVPDHILWGGDYGFYSSASADVVDYSRAYASWVMSAMGRAASRSVLEIACNDGVLLEPLVRAGCGRHLGVDPAAGPVKHARARGLNVDHAQFGRAYAEVLREDHGPFHVVIANNVIAHVADLDDFAAGLATILHEDGTAVVEFQYVPDLLVGNAVDHVYHEHRFFFSLTALQHVMNGHGLDVVSAAQTTPQGGSLRVQVQHSSPITFGDNTVRHLLQSERWLHHPHALQGMQGRADRVRDRLTDMLMGLHARKLRVAGYGASAKATTLLNWCGVDARLVQYMVDTTPAKHGRYMPGTDIPIISPTADSRSPDVYLLTVHNYLPGILRRETAFTARGGQWLVPVPAPVLL